MPPKAAQAPNATNTLQRSLNNSASATCSEVLRDPLKIPMSISPEAKVSRCSRLKSIATGQ